MLTKKQNLLETIKGGKPDRFVKQYEFLNIIYEAHLGNSPKPGLTVKDNWGVTFAWPEGQLGPFPVHDKEHKALQDITQWKKYVKVPPYPNSDEKWAPAVAHAKSVNRDEEL